MILTFSAAQKRDLDAVCKENTWVHSFHGALDPQGRNKEGSLEMRLPTHSLFH